MKQNDLLKNEKKKKKLKELKNQKLKELAIIFILLHKQVAGNFGNAKGGGGNGQRGTRDITKDPFLFSMNSRFKDHMLPNGSRNPIKISFYSQPGRLTGVARPFMYLYALFQSLTQSQLKLKHLLQKLSNWSRYSCFRKSHGKKATEAIAFKVNFKYSLSLALGFLDTYSFREVTDLLLSVG
jgi:hypothetical protein